MLVILGIVVFITLPQLTNSKVNADMAAAKAKATQFNIAKDAYIGLLGASAAQDKWTNAGTDDARFMLVRGLISPSVSNSVTQLNGTGGFSVPGYLILLSNDLAAERIVGMPVLLYQDVNLNGNFDNGVDTPVAY